MIEGYKPITTQIFDKDSKYLDDDSVFAVKDSLIVEFVPRKGDSKANFELRYDILMAPIGEKGELYCLVYFSEFTLIVFMMRVLYVEYRSVVSST